MAELYSTRLLFANLSAAGSSSAGPVPTNTIWVIVDAEFRTPQSTGSVSALFGISGSGFAVSMNLAGPDFWRQWRGRLVLNPGETLSAQLQGGPGVMAISGYVLQQGPA